MGINVSSYINTKTKTITTNSACYSTFNICNNPSYYNIFIEKEKIFYPLEEIFEYFEYLKKAGLSIGEYFQDEEGNIQVNIPSSKKMERLIASTVIRYLWENKYGQSRDEYFRIHDHFMNLCRYFPEKDFFKMLLFATNLYTTDNGSYTDAGHCIMGNCNGTKLISYERLIDSSSINSTLSFSISIKEFLEPFKKRNDYSTKEDYERAINHYNEELTKSIVLI